MSFKIWLTLVFLQCLGVGWAILVFSSPMPKHIAGTLAGTMFLLVGLFPIWALRNEVRRGRWVIFWSALIFLVGSVLPILAVRLFFWGQDFNTIHIVGFEASRLHGWAQSFYLAMIFATLWDGSRAFLLRRNR